MRFVLNKKKMLTSFNEMKMLNNYNVLNNITNYQDYLAENKCQFKYCLVMNKITEDCVVSKDFFKSIKHEKVNKYINLR